MVSWRKLLKTYADSNFNPQQLTISRDKSATNYKGKILEYLEEHAEARTQEISLYIGLKLSRTKDYLSELVEEGNIIANGANKNRTYSLKK